jgi:hypothetical protein
LCFVRPMRPLVAALLLVAAANTIASSREAEFRAALTAWGPGRFGRGSVVQGPLDFDTVERESLAASLHAWGGRWPQYEAQVDYWKRVRRILRPGDTFVFFRTDTRSWNEEGYAIIRGGRVVWTMMTRIS